MEQISQLITVITQSFKTIITAADEKALENARIAILGRNGSITELMEQFKKLSTEDKRTWGPRVQEVKQRAQELYNERKEFLDNAAREAAQEAECSFDVTAYKPVPVGRLHIYTQVIERIQDIAQSMGFDIVDGPELETEFYNFSALNIPENHPARELHDTFWISMPELLLRTQTSTIQIHTMQTQEPPIAICAPGRCYRNEATDASHDFMFTQAEFLFIDRTVSMGNLLATAQAFLQAFFEKENLDIRVRPGYFPFVEPGIEIDASCPFCTDGCSTCKHTRWIELLGAGLVHPNVLTATGIDPHQYNGFAFGVGIERLAMIKYGIQDIRLFHNNAIEFLDQF